MTSSAQGVSAAAKCIQRTTTRTSSSPSTTSTTVMCERERERVFDLVRLVNARLSAPSLSLSLDMLHRFRRYERLDCEFAGKMSRIGSWTSFHSIDKVDKDRKEIDRHKERE